MTRERRDFRQEAIDIAVAAAKQYPESYYVEPFVPHEWVIQAVMRAYDGGFIEGFDTYSAVCAQIHKE